MKNQKVKTAERIVIDFEFEGSPLAGAAKTMRDWLRLTLSYDRYQMAIANIEEQGNSSSLDNLYANPAQALDKAFTWDESEQGREYWSYIHRQLEQYEPDDDYEDDEDDEYDDSYDEDDDY